MSGDSGGTRSPRESAKCLPPSVLTVIADGRRVQHYPHFTGQDTEAQYKILDITQLLTDVNLDLSDIRCFCEFPFLTMMLWSESVFTIFLLVCLNSWPLQTDVFHSFSRYTLPPSALCPAMRQMVLSWLLPWCPCSLAHSWAWPR